MEECCAKLLTTDRVRDERAPAVKACRLPLLSWLLPWACRLLPGSVVPRIGMWNSSPSWSRIWQDFAGVIECSSLIVTVFVCKGKKQLFDLILFEDYILRIRFPAAPRAPSSIVVATPRAAGPICASISSSTPPYDLTSFHFSPIKESIVAREMTRRYDRHDHPRRQRRRHRGRRLCGALLRVQALQGPLRQHRHCGAVKPRGCSLIGAFPSVGSSSATKSSTYTTYEMRCTHP
ncbi:Thiazole biosynthetic enzyme Thi4 family [Panicum miliaceum]|uniref:Thiazole biosynthetic enzyme Thi4 family n=1 Tax=Panicum miliaceum TaxID=4540 RepID=A0A3L6TFY3_PANMI|nr:Thiazole biosynthetic enzyme Thi4 family [Panicum miliaceum]